MTVLLFGGEAYYPAGGWGDFLGSFESVDEAKAVIDAKVRRIEHPARPGFTEYPPPPGALVCSTNPPPSTGRWVPPIPAWTEVLGTGFAWAHIVVDDEIRWTWHELTWSDADPKEWGRWVAA